MYKWEVRLTNSLRCKQRLIRDSLHGRNTIYMKPCFILFKLQLFKRCWCRCLAAIPIVHMYTCLHTQIFVTLDGKIYKTYWKATVKVKIWFLNDLKDHSNKHAVEYTVKAMLSRNYMWLSSKRILSLVIVLIVNDSCRII